MKILIVSDAWKPQINGVVNTIEHVVTEGQKMGHVFEIVSPNDGFDTFPLPTYPEIRIAIGSKRKIERIFVDFQPDAVHIATEGSLGLTARAVCMKHKIPFTSSYHTSFPEYLKARAPIPLSAGYSYMRMFHKYSGRVMVTTASNRDKLEERGFANLAVWSRGVDTDVFSPALRDPDGGPLAGLPRPIFTYVGRVAVEKNIDAFLRLDLPGSKVVVGNGPAAESLQHKFADVHFAGMRSGQDLARHFANSDVFVFPSQTDTFGLVILEAMASGLPAAAFDVPGPKDLITDPKIGAIGPDLRASALACLKLEGAHARKHAEKYSWAACTQQFIEYLDPLPVPKRRNFWKRFLRNRDKHTAEGETSR